MDLNKRRVDAYQKNRVQPDPERENSPIPGEEPVSGKKQPERKAGGSKPERSQPVSTARDEPSRTVAGLLKVAGDGEPPARGVSKVARFLMAVGKDEAAAVLRHLSETEVEAVLREITTVSKLKASEAAEILHEFGREQRRRRLEPQGGAEVARQMLNRAFGIDVGQMIYDRIAPKESGRAFEFLEDLEPQQLATIARDESPAAIALIAAHLSPRSAASLIDRLPDETRALVVRRIAHMERVDTDVLARVEESLREKIRAHAGPETEEVDGMGALARILRTMNPTQGSEILRTLQTDEPGIFDQIQDRLFTIESLLLIDDQDLQKVLREFSDRDIALILKGKTEEIRGRILKNVSERRRIIIAEEYTHLGPVPRPDVDSAARAFLEHLRRLEEQGEIVVRRETDEYV